MKAAVHLSLGDGSNLEYMWTVAKFGTLCGAEISNGPATKEGMQPIRDVMVRAMLTKRLPLGYTGAICRR